LNILFAYKQDYYSGDTIETFRFKMKKIQTEKLKYPLDNITGTVNEDDSFSFTHKWSVIRVGKPVHLTGNFYTEGRFTKVSIVINSNPILVIIFYLLIILFFCEVFGVETFVSDAKNNVLVAYPFGAAMFFCFIRIYTNGLKSRFEKLMKLNTIHSSYRGKPQA
jgi:hypothetical protein